MTLIGLVELFNLLTVLISICLSSLIPPHSPFPPVFLCNPNPAVKQFSNSLPLPNINRCAFNLCSHWVIPSGLLCTINLNMTAETAEKAMLAPIVTKDMKLFPSTKIPPSVRNVRSRAQSLDHIQQLQNSGRWVIFPQLLRIAYQHLFLLLIIHSAIAILSYSLPLASNLKRSNDFWRNISPHSLSYRKDTEYRISFPVSKTTWNWNGWFNCRLFRFHFTRNFSASNCSCLFNCSTSTYPTCLPCIFEHRRSLWK